jgi:hypothetical protein
MKERKKGEPQRTQRAQSGKLRMKNRADLLVAILCVLCVLCG